MRQITILDAHSPQETEQDIIVLGVHSFLSPLLSFQGQQCLSILLVGETADLVDKVLWNEFYSGTLIRDCHRFLALEGNSDNTFLKVNGRTFKLLDSLHYSTSSQLRLLVQKCQHFTLEGFKANGSIARLSIQIGKVSNYSPFHLVFYYNNNKKNNPSLSKAHSKSKVRQSIASKPKSKPNSAHKYQSETKKVLADCSNKQNGFHQRSAFNLTENKTKVMQRTKVRNDSRMSSLMGKSVSECTVTDRMKDVMGSILMEKQNKLKRYEMEAKAKKSEHEVEIENLNKKHQEEMIEVKAKVQQVLKQYKVQNKALRKENLCLAEHNDKISLSLQSHIQENETLKKQVSEVSTQLAQRQSQRLYLIEKLASAQANLLSLKAELASIEKKKQQQSELERVRQQELDKMADSLKALRRF